MADNIEDKTNILDVVPQVSPRVSPIFKENLGKIFADVYSQSDPDLPLLPERHRLFAFRWATESRTSTEWASIFHVTRETISLWKKNPKIVRYYLVIRRKQNLIAMERMKVLESKAFTRLYDLLDMPLSEKNAEVMRKTVMGVLGIDTENGINFNLDATGKGSSITVSSKKSSLGKTEEKEVKVDLGFDALRDKLDEMELMEKMVNVTPAKGDNYEDAELRPGQEDSTSDLCDSGREEKEDSATSPDEEATESR